MVPVEPDRQRSPIDSPDSPVSPQSESQGGLSGPASPSALILLPDTEEQDLYDLESDDDESDDECDSQLEVQRLPIPPLGNALVFLYLLSPYLRLGALYITDGGDPISLRYGLLTLMFAASLSTFCRHLWFMLGRYLRKFTFEDILIEAFVRGRGQGRQHIFARCIISSAVALFRVLLAAMYFRDSVNSVLQLVPEDMRSFSLLYISAFLGFFVLVLSIPNTVAAKPVIYASTLSTTSYLAWLIAVSHANATGSLGPVTSWPQRGILWIIYSSIVFACTTTLTVPLSASLTGSLVVWPVKQHRTRRFKLLNISSTVLATLLMLPLVAFASLRAINLSGRTLATPFSVLVPILRATTISLAIPSIIVSTPMPRFLHMGHCHPPTTPVKFFYVLSAVLLSLASPSVANTIRDLTLVLACSGTFLLPALTHVTIHYLRRPLAIVVPQEPHPVAASPRSTIAGSRSASRPSVDPLLQRKEQYLQRRRLGKRLLWDVGIWLVLIPTCTCAFIWAAGCLLGKW
ncbi:hypothetical protein M404DRAFT_1006810 [Pisolithus tinctorius Marx 270]|uniref:Amino acid transporter transmembrane domain-containing protein n=1 Tax=Pisolithus tinctorius Marx 270 TaxID=870435 RepID=A0A0C3NKY0_PISTI|nr:hypothetical protein M404DRAFT_1006810 [Pisolithus tinctorius Marx 270]